MMKWDKTPLGYLLWALYTIAAGAALFLTGESFGGTLGITGMESYLAGGIALAFPLLVFAILRLVLRSGKGKKNRKGRGKRNVWKQTGSVVDRADKADSQKTVGKAVAEAIIFLGFLIAGILMRLSWLPYAGEEAAYFDAARMGVQLPQVAHGATYFYLQVLHLLFWLTGNKWMAGIWLQLGLQLGACGLLYIGVRKIAGVIPALTMTGFLMLSQREILAGVTYSPQMLYRCFFACGLLTLVAFFQGSVERDRTNVYDYLLLLLSGLAVGLLCYLDITGVVLAAGALAVFSLSGKKEGFGKNLLKLFLYLAGAAGAFAGFLFLDAYASRKTFPGVVRAWQSLYLTKAYDLWFWQEQSYPYFYLLLFSLLVLGSLGYWCRKREQKLTPWILMTATLCGIGFFHMSAEEMDSKGLLVLFYSIMAGIGISESLCRNREPVYENISLPVKEKTEMKQPYKGIPNGQERKQEGPSRYIENPLPLPKRHERRNLSYGYEPGEDEMYYDLEVPDEDDFDLP